jgi:hypothetical protein
VRADTRFVGTSGSAQQRSRYLGPGSSEPESRARGHHRCSPRPHGRDDLLGVDALQGRSRWCRESHAPSCRWMMFSGTPSRSELERVRVAQLVRGEPTPDAGAGGDPAELGTHRRGRPGPPACAPVDDAGQRPDGQPGTRVEPGRSCVPSPTHPCRPRACGRPCRGEPAAVRAAARSRARRRRAPLGATARRATRPTIIARSSVAVALVAGVAHRGHDLVDGWRVRRVAHPPVAGRPPRVVAGHRHGRAASPRRVQQHGHGTSSKRHPAEPARRR